MAKLNIITNQTGYVTFDVYDKITGNLSYTYDVPKIAVTSIQTYPNEVIDDTKGVVTITTIFQEPSYNKRNGLIKINPSLFAPSTAATTPYTDTATLRAALIGYFSSKW
jgi:hypothetical protein